MEKNCKNCIHYRALIPISSILHLYTVRHHVPSNVMPKIMEEEKKYLDQEVGEKMDNERSGQTAWYFKPRMSHFCAEKESEEIYEIIEIKNKNNKCGSYKENEAVSEKDCHKCKHFGEANCIPANLLDSTRNSLKYFKDSSSFNRALDDIKDMDHKMYLDFEAEILIAWYNFGWTYDVPIFHHYCNLFKKDTSNPAYCICAYKNPHKKCRHFQERFVRVSDGMYDGDFVNGKRNGNGTLIDQKGRLIYKGNWVDGKKNGKGIFYYSTGDKYEGDFVDDKMTGKGRLTNPKGSLIYEGDWVDGKKNGKGIFYYSTGDKYEGDFVDDKMTGKGKFTWKYGLGDTYYSGDFIDGMFWGEGTMVSNFKRTQTGYWLKNMYIGIPPFDIMVERTFTGKQCFFTPSGDWFEGDYVNGKMNGKGTLIVPKGVKYEGDFVDSKYQGKGILTCPNGDHYEGDFVDGKMTGKGILICVNGDRYEGNFVNFYYLGPGDSGKGTKAAGLPQTASKRPSGARIGQTPVMTKIEFVDSDNFTIYDGISSFDGGTGEEFYWLKLKEVVHDFTARVSVRWDSGIVNKGFGMVFRVTADNLNLYLFQIAPNGYYHLMRLINNEWSGLLIDWQQTDLVKPGFNVLTVTYRGTSIICYLNGNQVINIQDSTPTGTPFMIGIGANGGMKCSFSDFEVCTDI